MGLRFQAGFAVLLSGEIHVTTFKPLPETALPGTVPQRLDLRTIVSGTSPRPSRSPQKLPPPETSA
jgi:hypothetical protein